MNGTSLVLDTNIVLYTLEGNDELVDFLEDKQLLFSVVSEMELFSYPHLTTEVSTSITEFLSKWIVLNILPGIKEIAIAVRREYRLKLPDAIIAATAMSFEIPLLTSDKVFNRIEKLNLLYYSH